MAVAVSTVAHITAVNLLSVQCLAFLKPGGQLSFIHIGSQSVLCTSLNGFISIRLTKYLLPQNVGRADEI